MVRALLIAVLVVAGALWLGNSSMLLAPQLETQPRVLAHRGIFQSYPVDEVGRDTCTASLINPPQHDLLENTIASMRAAFEAGADVVELDVHLTPDGKFAVFHDWTLECRTDGKGVTEQTPYAVLKTLDIGYGYTADGGKTFPFRGKGKGLMPELTEVFEALPNGRFLINFKSRRAEEGTALADLVRARPEFWKRIFGVYGGAQPTRAAVAGIPGLRGFDPQSVKTCLLRYAAFGWSGRVPAACRNTIVAIPANAAPWLWGWPYKFVARMQAAGTDVILLGPWSGGATAGIDRPDELALVPEMFGGLVWTNRTETMAKPIRAR
ncbi:glycerophosphoryl diester phosphodiesterase [Afipia sp. P52-10]|jgi:glycerophosphoryl diester phosphodiesterase|uniref:glycerophosphodiester phosphodiesterase family protein n=1 Tax=Afipia sp. P52-10 TaxID=1429916 RepID=UPI0003DEFBFE|nr:glycerophosphodiester phosphodiesterase family protein [Afipia sp. P52-10]ETR77007.1 glycerophosphoryl diester phosphodiesterase [Afipia sp. P52-10]